MQVKAVGSAISFLLNGVQKISVTDTSFTGGAPGMIVYGTSQLDNWLGGGAAGSAAYSVGGTVSGLSGTVVLQDNGGDNLPVTGNGPFTFATSLAGGTAYAVTVKTNPTGQTCTVSNGSGTIGAANVANVAVSCVNVAGVLGGGDPVWAVGDGGAAGQRRGQPALDRQRAVYVRDLAGGRGRLRGDGEDQPHRPDLHRV